MANWGSAGDPPRRPRVEALLARRWSVPVMQVVAGAGSGKTTALRSAVEANRLDPQGIDVYAAVEPEGDLDRALTRLAEQLAEFGDADDLVRTATALAPRHVSLIIDDAHKLTDPDELLRLPARLPANVHLVIASREPLDLGDAPAIVDDDLGFDDDEIADLAKATGRDVDGLTSIGRWAAGVDLAATAGRAAVDRAVGETLLGELSPDLRLAVETLAIVGRADDALLAALGVPTLAVTLAEHVPLIRQEDSDAVAHDLLRDALRTRVPEASAMRRTAAATLAGTGADERAADLLVDDGDWEAALDVVATTAIGGLSSAGHSVARRWLNRVPPEYLDHPTCGLMRAAIARRQDPAIPQVRTDLEAAISEFRARGHQAGELAGLTILGYLHARVTGDLLGLAGVHARVSELHEAGCHAAAGLAMLGTAVISHVTGDTAGAIRLLDALPRASLTAEWQGIADWYHCMALLDLGRPDDAVAVRDHTVDGDMRPMEEQLHGTTWARWARGQVVEVSEELRHGVDHPDDQLPRERADSGLYAMGLLSAVGDLAAARRGEALVRAHIGPDDHTLRGNLTVSETMLAVAEGDEARAASLLRSRFPDGLGGPDDWRSIIRLLPLPYVTMPETRDAIDAHGAPGVWAHALDGARLLVRARVGAASDWTHPWWDDPGRMVANLGLRWTLELAGRAHNAGFPDARAACSQILEWFPDAIRILGMFREDVDASLAKGAASLLAELPAPPSAPVDITLLGPASMRRGDIDVTDKDWRRERVRALLSLLVIHRTVTRERASTWLWPDLSAERAAANMRTTLNYLQRVLEPDRPKNAAPWSVRNEGTTLRIVVDDHLSVDVWEFEHRADTAERLEAAGDPVAALDDRLAAIALWNGDPFVECRYEEWALAEAERLRLRLLRQLVRAAEVSGAVGRASEAIELANRALVIEPTAENAARALVEGHLVRNDIGSARAVHRRTLASLEEQGFTPEPATLELGRRLGQNET